jgi:hypothetical protein
LTRLFIRDGHPMPFSLDDAVFQHTVTHEWNHGLGEIVTALLDAGLTDNPARLACSFTIQAVNR